MATTAAAKATKGAGRGGALDALRFLAAAFVVLYHFGAEAPIAVDSFAPVLARGWLATDFFLMLSGYVLGRAYGEALDGGRLGAGDFLLRRVARVWPAHLIVLAAFVGLVALATLTGVGPIHPERFGGGEFVAQALLVHAWGVVHQAAWNVPSWTLSALVVCYAGFPLVWRASRKLDGRVAALMGALDVLAIGALVARLGLHRSAWDLPFDLGLARALPVFLCGLLLARAASGLKFGHEALAAAIGAGVALALFQAAPRSDLTDLGSLVALAFVILCADGIQGRSRAWAEKGAALSFSLFITHAFAGAIWFGALRVMEARLPLLVEARWGLWMMSFPFAIAVAQGFHRWVDAPLQARLRAALARRRPVAPPDAEAEPART